MMFDVWKTGPNSPHPPTSICTLCQWLCRASPLWPWAWPCDLLWPMGCRQIWHTHTEAWKAFAHLSLLHLSCRHHKNMPTLVCWRMSHMEQNLVANLPSRSQPKLANPYLTPRLACERSQPSPAELLTQLAANHRAWASQLASVNPGP